MIADNNILNIRALPKRQLWLGQYDEWKGFCCFLNTEYCIRAWCRLMRTYRVKYGLKTISGIILRYAPPSENDTEDYIDFCARQVGVSRITELTEPLDYAALCVAMAKMETGTDISKVSVVEVMAKYGTWVTYENE